MISVLLTGKHRSRVSALVFVLQTGNRLVVATQHTGDAYTWQALPLASFNNKWKALLILSLISGGIQTVCTSHTSSDERSKENLSHSNTTFFFFFYKCSSLLLSSILDRTVGMITRHSTQGTQRRFILSCKSEQKKGPFVRGRNNVVFSCKVTVVSNGVVFSNPSVVPKA